VTLSIFWDLTAHLNPIQRLPLDIPGMIGGGTSLRLFCIRMNERKPPIVPHMDERAK
jgi:hypothetical protein